MDKVAIALSVLAGIVILVFSTVLYRTRKWGQNGGEPPLKGLALPAGSIRGIIGIFVVASFVVFIFFGANLFNQVEEIYGPDGEVTNVITTPDFSLYTTVLTAFATLTGAVTGFYFGGRSTQNDTKTEISETVSENGKTEQQTIEESNSTTGVVSATEAKAYKENDE